MRFARIFILVFVSLSTLSAATVPFHRDYYNSMELSSSFQHQPHSQKQLHDGCHKSQFQLLGLPPWSKLQARTLGPKTPVQQQHKSQSPQEEPSRGRGRPRTHQLDAKREYKYPCSICLESMRGRTTRPIYKLPRCLHRFHKHCADGVEPQQSGKVYRCPLCRLSFLPPRLHGPKDISAMFDNLQFKR